MSMDRAEPILSQLASILGPALRAYAASTPRNCDLHTRLYWLVGISLCLAPSQAPARSRLAQ